MSHVDMHAVYSETNGHVMLVGNDGAKAKVDMKKIGKS